MGRASARYIGKCFGMDAKWTYEVLEDMGFVIKNKIGDWILTKAGEEIGGRYSANWGVPTFKLEVIVDLMNDFLKKKFG